MDPRIEKLSHTLTYYSTRLAPRERILIDIIGEDAYPLAEALIKDCYDIGAYPYLHLSDPRLERALTMQATEEQLSFDAKLKLEQMKGMDAYIAVHGGDNISEYADVPVSKMNIKNKCYSDVIKERVDRSKWVVLRYPNGSMAQNAGMSTEAFENYYFEVCTMDYAKMSRAMDALVERMMCTDKVHIIGPGTDLSFSIKDVPAIKCAGDCNIPDGEVYTAPVRDSVNGTITYNVPSHYQGFTFENVSLQFEDGRIINASANDNDRINAVLNTDPGARYIGELGIGVNPYIKDPMKDILFDEKISGSIHFTPGACYEDAPNGNSSDIHWDLVLIQTVEYGGGEIWFDNELIRKDGFFIPEYLHCLNPDVLINH